MWSQAGAELGDSASVWHAAVSKSVYCSACSRPHSRYVYSQISSRSRSAAGDSRYSAMSAAKPTLKRICVEAFGLAALLALNQRSTNTLDLQASLLLTANEVANVLAVVRVVATLDLRLDPVVLLVGLGNSFAYGRHAWIS